MKPYQTLILFIICLVLVAYIFLVEVKKEPKPETDPQLVVTDIDPLSLEKCAFTIAGKDEVVLVRNEENRFEIEKPILARADNEQIERILTSLTSITADRVLEGVTNDQNNLYGFDQPQATVKLFQKEKPVPIKLVFGRNNPVGYSIYLRKNENPTVYSVGEFLFTSFNIELDHYREHTLLPNRENIITSVTVNFNNQEQVFTKKDGTWYIEKPYFYRTSYSKMTAIIDKIKEIRINEFLDQETASTEKALKSPVATIQISYEGLKESDICSIGDTTTDKENRYARLQSDPQPVFVDPDCLKVLVIDFQDLIDTKLLSKYEYEYQKLTVNMAGQKYSFSKSDTNWVPETIIEDVDNQLLDAAVSELFSAITTIELNDFHLDQQPAPSETDSVSLTLTVTDSNDSTETLFIADPETNNTGTQVWTDNGLPPSILTTEQATSIFEKAQNLINLMISKPAEETETETTTTLGP